MTERLYSAWKCGERNVPEDPTRCVEPVYVAALQCWRRRGHGKDGLYCKQHAKKHPAKVES